MAPEELAALDARITEAQRGVEVVDRATGEPLPAEVAGVWKLLSRFALRRELGYDPQPAFPPKTAAPGSRPEAA